jgi:PilZ domain
MTFFFAMEVPQSKYDLAKVYLRSGRWTRREGIVAIKGSPQRRKVNRKAQDRRVVRVETKDYQGNPRYITADLLDSSEIGLGVALRAPLEAGSSIIVRTNVDPARANVPRRVRVNWCEEKPDGTFQAGLEFV